MEVTTGVIKKIILIQTPRTDTVLWTVQTVHHAIEINFIQTMETETIRKIDHGFTLTLDHITTITIINPEITQESKQQLSKQTEKLFSTTT